MNFENYILRVENKIELNEFDKAFQMITNLPLFFFVDKKKELVVYQLNSFILQKETEDQRVVKAFIENELNKMNTIMESLLNYE